VFGGEEAVKRHLPEPLGDRAGEDEIEEKDRRVAATSGEGSRTRGMKSFSGSSVAAVLFVALSVGCTSAVVPSSEDVAVTTTDAPAPPAPSAPAPQASDAPRPTDAAEPEPSNPRAVDDVNPPTVPARAPFPSEIVGPVADGDTRQASVPDSTTPIYRAFTMSLEARDTLTATVDTGPVGRQAVVALLGPGGAPIQFARGPGRITLTATVTTTGTYTLSLREQQLRAATFDVSVAIRKPAPLLTDGASCGAASECASGKCTNDGISGITGVCGNPRANGASCSTYRDCTSGTCNAGVCAPPVLWSVPPSLAGREVSAITDCGWVMTLKFAPTPVAPGVQHVRATDCEYSDFCWNLYGRGGVSPSPSVGATSWKTTKTFTNGMGYGQYTDSLEVAYDPAGTTDLVVTATTTFRRSSNACPVGAAPTPGSTCRPNVPGNSVTTCRARIPR
jgi:hypothetical protein